MTDILTSDARASGTFAIGGDLVVNRIGYGAMRIAGPGVWGAPRDRAAALATLRRLPKLGVNFIDTADSYGPDVSEQLIYEALHPYERLVVATKAGLKRPGPDQWAPHGDPDYLISQAHRSRELLGVDKIDLWQLHRIDPKVPAGEQFDAIARLLAEGVIRHAGLSQVTVEEIKTARAVFPVSTVQNRYNLGDRSSEDVLDYCEREGIGFIPWYPLSAGRLTENGSVLDRIAHEHGATPGQIALAWLLQRSPVLLPIPGTGQVHHLEENVAAAGIRLSNEAFAELDAAGRS